MYIYMCVYSLKYWDNIGKKCDFESTCKSFMGMYRAAHISNECAMNDKTLKMHYTRGGRRGVSREIRDIHVGALCEKYGNNIAEAKQNSPLHMKYVALLTLLVSSTSFLAPSKVPHPCGSLDLMAHSRFQKYRHWISKCSLSERARNAHRISAKEYFSSHNLQLSVQIKINEFWIKKKILFSNRTWL